MCQYLTCGWRYPRRESCTRRGSPVCTENLNPDVVVMKSAKDRV